MRFLNGPATSWSILLRAAIACACSWASRVRVGSSATVAARCSPGSWRSSRLRLRRRERHRPAPGSGRSSAGSASGRGRRNRSTRQALRQSARSGRPRERGNGETTAHGRCSPPRRWPRNNDQNVKVIHSRASRLRAPAGGSSPTRRTSRWGTGITIRASRKRRRISKWRSLRTVPHLARLVATQVTSNRSASMPNSTSSTSGPGDWMMSGCSTAQANRMLAHLLGIGIVGDPHLDDDPPHARWRGSSS